ncbi:diguanylate cyclase [Pseudoroseomonas cervicalis]|uniref:GGDEF domain-containing response regulator n=1 Tax=Teichococcus cervicalis TaxID=204525 RepID=UPI00278631BC|nr:diguanylate cyclase [Pseudoroseomonas cervicalis]MDQ1080579.1 diguanylate cyclase (GGDEF)-like protein [Pseudoroseomonas cervicalis]
MPEAAGQDIREALRRLRAEGVARLGERVAGLQQGWAALMPPPWDEPARQTLGELAASAHRLAGAGGTFGFPALSAAAAPLELLLLGLREEAAPRADRLRQVERLIEAVRQAWMAGPDPAAEAAAEGAAAPAPDAAEPLYLFAEKEGQAGLSTLFAHLGYAVLRLPDGVLPGGALPEGTRLAGAVVDDSVPDALIACRHFAARCPVVLLSAETGFAARLAAARAGVEAVVPKPADLNELADWLDQFAGPRHESPASILVVDDDSLLAEAYALALRQAGMQVTTVSAPEQAIDAMAAINPDLVLMDMQMPGVEGIELARIIRQSRRSLSLPILFLSAEQDEQRQILARRLGGDDFIPKPVDLDRLATLVRLRAERARALRAMMDTDSLTGLLNHARFKDRLELELLRAWREGQTLSLALIDLDHFKSVNDTHGHLMGDRVIRGLARSLQRRLRRTDLLGRYGGEEFAVLLLNTPPEAARGLIDAIRSRFAATVFETGTAPLRVSFSAGIAGLPPEGSGEAGGAAEAMISAADAALYAAKRAGRNQVALAEPQEVSRHADR